jgi:TonB family protein
VRPCLLACCCIALFALTLNVRSQQTGAAGGWHGQPCTEKNPKPDCLPIPHLISSPPPTYKAKVERECVLALVVDEKGNIADIRVVNSVGAELDEKAIEAVRKWKFEPAYDKTGKHVSSRLPVEVLFRP